MTTGCTRAGFYLHYGAYYFSGGKPAAECGEGPGFKYCLHRAPKGVNDDPESVLYFLHYAGGDERSWSRIPFSRVYYAEFKRRGLPAPQVVSVSYGPFWNLFDKPGPKHPKALFGHFVDEALPFLDTKSGKPKRRYLWGMSQGSLNGALLVLKRPELWSGAVLSCPAWYTIPVFASEMEINAYVARNRADPKKVRWAMGLIRERVAGPEEWAREDPLARARAAQGLPPLYIDGSRGDEYGFFEGAQAMAKALGERGQDVAFHAESGLHCQVDAVQAAAYLAERTVSSRDPRAR